MTSAYCSMSLVVYWIFFLRQPDSLKCIQWFAFAFIFSKKNANAYGCSETHNHQFLNLMLLLLFNF